MKVTILAQDAVTARREAETRLRGPVHISCVFFVKGDPTVREWVFSKVLVLQ